MVFKNLRFYYKLTGKIENKNRPQNDLREGPNVVRKRLNGSQAPNLLPFDNYLKMTTEIGY